VLWDVNEKLTGIFLMQSEEKRVRIKIKRAYIDWMLKEVIKILFVYIAKDKTRFS
jgi:hypothetical protein